MRPVNVHAFVRLAIEAENEQCEAIARLAGPAALGGIITHRERRHLDDGAGHDETFMAGPEPVATVEVRWKGTWLNVSTVWHMADVPAWPCPDGTVEIAPTIKIG